jgi:hypothetical protein
MNFERENGIPSLPYVSNSNFNNISIKIKYKNFNEKKYWILNISLPWAKNYEPPPLNPTHDKFSIKCTP